VPPPSASSLTGSLAEYLGEMLSLLYRQDKFFCLPSPVWVRLCQPALADTCAELGDKNLL